jgi:hypothetical protein
MRWIELCQDYNQWQLLMWTTMNPQVLLPDLLPQPNQEMHFETYNSATEMFCNFWANHLEKRNKFNISA